MLSGLSARITDSTAASPEEIDLACEAPLGELGLGEGGGEGETLWVLSLGSSSVEGVREFTFAAILLELALFSGSLLLFVSSYESKEGMSSKFNVRLFAFVSLS